jgi:exodeoxyribonuclease VII small subunit
MAAAPKGKKFEDELKDLEQIVTRIDSGELSLEDSIAAFERGVSLVRSLNQKLDEIERKVEVLTRNSQGELRTTPMKEDAEEPSPPARRDSQRNGDADDDDIPF